MRRDTQINLRIDRDLKIRLLKKDNMTGWIMEAIEEKLLRELDKDFIDTKIKEYELKIKELKGAIKNQIVLTDRAEEIIEEFIPQYRQRKINGASDKQLLFWIDSRVKPSINKAGTRYKAGEILKIFIDKDS